MSIVVTVKQPSGEVVIREGSDVVRVFGGVPVGAGAPSPGPAYVTNATVVGGSVTAKVYQDANNNVLQSFTASSLSVRLTVRSFYPRVRAGGSNFDLPLVGGVYQGDIDATLASGSNTLQIVTPDGSLIDADAFVLTLDAPPVLSALSFSGAYPGAQTELKAGDTFTIVGTADKTVDQVEVLDFGAGAPSITNVTPGTSFSITMTVADRGTTLQNLPARVRVRGSVSQAYSATRDTNTGGGTVNGVNLLALNNLGPTASWGAVVYPPTQQALKASESATVGLTIANATSIVVDSPNGDLSIANPTTIEASKTVTRIAGSYNVSINNLRVVATRSANAKTTTAQVVVNIANAAPTVSITVPAARLRSGGNNGTAAVDHTVSIVSDQQLLSAPSVSAGAGGGTFQGAGFVGGPSTWTRQLRVHDDDVKGNYSFTGLSATGLSGLVQNAISSGSSYVLGGFVSRSLTFAAFATTTTIGSAVVDFAKLQAGTFTATNQPALKQPIGTPAPVTNGYTIVAAGVNPTALTWLDTAAASSNSGGTAQITGVEETV